MPEMLSPVGGENLKSYRLSKEQVDALRMEAQDISPELQEAYFLLEKKTCEAFLEIYGKYLSSEQIEYMKKPSVIVASKEAAESLASWDESIVHDFETSQIDGEVYNSYSSGEIEKDGGAVDDLGYQIWSGRVAVVPPLKDLTRDVDEKFLVSDEELDSLLDARKARFADIEKQFVTNIWAAMALHEKIHGIQDPDLPLPILETSANSYERVVFDKNHWQPRSEYGWENTTLVWEALSEHYGDDLALLIFGNLKDKDRAVEILDDIKSELSPKRNPHLYKGINWEAEKK